MTENLEQKILLAKINKELVADEIGNFIVKEITDCGYTGGVIGLSGGVDSTLTAILAKRAFDKYNSAKNDSEKLELIGYMLPSKVNSVNDAIDGKYVADKIGIRSEEISIEPIVDAYRYTNPEAFDRAYDKGNMMSRIRANILQTKAATSRKLVLGTGNRDEDFGVGYYTLFGDGAVHMSPIGNLPKRLVREMTRHYGFPEIADRIPTAGLEPGQSDFKDLGYSYDMVELVSEGMLQGIKKEDLYGHSQIIVQANKEMSDYKNTFGKPKFNDVSSMLTDVLNRMYVANKKSEIVSPPIAEITLRYDA